MGRTQMFHWFRRFKEVEPPLKATPARDDRQHREKFKLHGYTVHQQC